MTTDRTLHTYFLGPNTPQNGSDLRKLYQDRIRQFGFEGRTLLYTSNQRHTLKVQQYCKILSCLVAEGDILLDIGCGYGSLAEQLLPLLPQCTYQGIDLIPEFIQYAQQMYGKPGTNFLVKDIRDYSEQSDWAILLGVVNSIAQPDEVISQAWDKCRKGLVIDLNDNSRYPETAFNTFNIDHYVQKFYNKGAHNIQVYETSDIWTILIVQKTPFIPGILT